MLKRIVAENWFKPQAAVGFWPAAGEGDDIHLYEDDARQRRLATFFTLAPAAHQARRPAQRRARRFRRARAIMSAASSSRQALEEEAISGASPRANDDYSSILVKALADRFAEALAEDMHARVRRELWGYAPDESLRARGADRRDLSRHPPRARLSRPARPYREGDPVPPARRRGARPASG